MSEQRHMPGPWNAEGLEVWAVGSRRINLTSVGTPKIAEVCEHNIEGQSALATARLIAAAPDMDLLLSGVACGVIRSEPGTRELAFDGLRYSLGLNPDWATTVGIMGRDRLVAAIAKARNA